MSLLGSAILTICMGATGDYQPACNTALEKTAETTGFDKSVDYFEQRSTRYADRLAEEELGADGKSYLGSTLYIARVVVDRRVTVNLPTMGWVDQAQSQLTPSSFMLTFRWSFQWMVEQSSISFGPHY